jgi:2-oxo-4-hydroxy-4-carboxy-5-ureidoimidazoline decarboxylase
MTGELADVAAFDTMPAADAGALLRPACASSAWAAAMIAGRPYGSLDALAARSDGVLAGLDWPDVEEALTAHPRIGERATGNDREAAWSRQEQSGASGAAGDLRTANVEYERRFGHVFLICATGRSSDEILAALRDRLGNDERVEHELVRAELTQIVRLRLAKTFR